MLSTGTGTSEANAAAYSVREFGAAGDGITDDTAAIQEAITAAVSVSKNVLIPDGNFLIDPDTITISSSVTIESTSSGAELTLATDGVAFTIASDDVTLRGLTLNADSDESVLADGDGWDRTTITGCTINEARLLTVNRPGPAYASASASGESKDLVLTGNVVRCTNLTTLVESAIDLRYVVGATVTDNRIDGHRYGITWWGGGADPVSDDGAIANARKCGDMTITGNVVTNCGEMGVAEGGAGIWGSMGQRITIAGNVVKNCADVCIDTEGGVDVAITGNTAADGTNGAITTFYLNQGVTTLADGKVIWIYLANNQEDNREIVIVGNAVTSYGTIGTCGGDAAASVTFSQNVLRNTTVAFAGNYTKTPTVAGNILSFDEAAGGAFAAIEVSKQHANGLGRIIANTIRSTVAQPAGSTGIYSFQDDFNSSPLVIIESNTITDFPIDIEVEADSAHASRTPHFMIRNNVVGSANIVRTEGTASASESVTFLEGNRDEVGVPVPSAVPGSGKWNQGQIVWDDNPAAGGPPGWVCVTTGTPGTWKAMANLAA
jgi:hypothetical protein